jgi:hypothetical protein
MKAHMTRHDFEFVNSVGMSKLAKPILVKRFDTDLANAMVDDPKTSQSVRNPCGLLRTLVH